MLSAGRNKLRQRYKKWVDRRLPAAPKIKLNNRSLFIFPTRAGFVYIALLILLWLVATNYENNLIFGAAFLLTAMFVVTIYHTFLNLSGLQIAAGRIYPAYSGGQAGFGIVLSQSTQRYRDNLKLRYAAADQVCTFLDGGEQQAVSLAVTAKHRGWLNPGRLTLETVYPLGLLRAWTHLDLKMRALVYPRPVHSQVRWLVPSTGEGQLENSTGREDFQGLEKYRPGESLKHVAWKHYAREQGLYSKHFADPVAEQVWLDWDAFPGMDSEARLSRLCGWLLELAQTDSVYGLRLPGVEIEPGRGETHRDHILRELALFELAPMAGSE